MDGSYSLKNAAIEYAKRGYYIAPLWPCSKMPMCGLKYSKPSRDIEVIEYWWNCCPEANIALPTGTQYNNLVVIDLDITLLNNGMKTFEEILIANNLVLPKTLTIESGSHGNHLYFRNVEKISICSAQSVFDGIDILAAGAHVVAPPSVHENGNNYKVKSKSFLEIADANDSVYSFLELCKVI